MQTNKTTLTFDTYKDTKMSNTKEQSKRRTVELTDTEFREFQVIALQNGYKNFLEYASHILREHIKEVNKKK